MTTTITVYCDEHARVPIGPALMGDDVPIRDGVFLLAQYRRDETGAWLPASVISSGGDVVWTPRRWRWQDESGTPVSSDHPAVGELDRIHVVLRHRGCRRTVRMSYERLSVLLDSLVPQEITGVSLKYLELVNTRI